MRLRLIALGLCAVAVSACGPLGGPATDDPKAIAPEKLKMEGTLVPKDGKAVDLHGLDQLTKVPGSCFSEYIVLPGGLDDAATQRYILSFHLKGDPQDEAALYVFLGKNKCGKQQAEIHDSVVKALGLVSDGSKPDPIDISYKTISGRRLFL
jgi:hypothetical protein